MKDLVILIPGIGGSRLIREDGGLAYDFSIGALPTLLTQFFSGFESLRYSCDSRGAPNDGIKAAGLFSDQLIPGFFGVEDYEALLKTLVDALPLKAEQLRIFPYDWRASNAWTAQKLQTFALAELDGWQKKTGANDAKLWLICHSMGGLVARYFCEHLGGEASTRRVITIGTPHSGATKALNVLVNGMRFGFKLGGLTEVLRSMPSVYELLPLYPAVEITTQGKTSTARVADFFGLSHILPTRKLWTPTLGLNALPNLNAKMLEQSLNFHASIRTPILNRIKTTGQATQYDVDCIFNRRQPTPQLAHWRNDTLEVTNQSVHSSGDPEKEHYERGDGTVPGFSAVPFEFDDTSMATLVHEQHTALPSSQAVRDLLFNRINPLVNLVEMSDGKNENQVLALDSPEIVKAAEPFTVVIDAIKGGPFTLRCVDAKDGRKILEKPAKVESLQKVSLEIKLSQPGCYVLEVGRYLASGPSTRRFVIVLA